MIYFDSAYIAKCYLNETGAAPVRQLARNSTGISSNDLARVEVVSAIRRYGRETSAAAAVINQIFADFDSDVAAGVLTFWPTDSALVAETARQLRALPLTVPLRTVDAIHLVCANMQGFKEVFTNDQRMLAAAPQFGLAGINVIGK